jgi:hypothetical protein
MREMELPEVHVYTVAGLSASVLMTCCSPKFPLPSVFSYQASLWSFHGRWEHIFVAIAVNVSSVHRMGPVCLGRDDPTNSPRMR